VLRLTPFTQPSGLDAALAALGYEAQDDTRVMVCRQLAAQPRPSALPAGTFWRRLDGAAYADAVGALRGSPPEQRRAHAERLAHAPVPCQGYAICRDDDRAVLACGQFAREAEIVGLYDVHTAAEHRRLGLGRILCERLLSIAVSEGAELAYLQVDADNVPARSVYTRMGFADAYAYHYRHAP
jgi:ribosomal protein S18 acetylase RimI-like enzyme